jgi:FkbM family methyltransferase
MKNSKKNIARFLGSRIGKKNSSKIITAIHKSSDAPLLKLAYQHYGILKYKSLEYSGEAFVLKEIIKKLVREDEALIDVGANIGEYSRFLLQHFGKNRIIAFEPNGAAFTSLKKSLPNLEIYNHAIANENGEIEFFTSEEDNMSTQSSFTRESIPENQTPKSITVKAIRLDSFFDSHEIEKVGFLKTDTEGHDLVALKSCGEHIPQIKFIQFEFNEKYVYTRTFLKDFYEILTPTHDLFRIDTDRLHDIREYIPTNEIFRYQNILAIRKDLTSSALKGIKVQ